MQVYLILYICKAVHLCPVCYAVLGCSQHVCCHCCFEKFCDLLCVYKCIRSLMTFPHPVYILMWREGGREGEKGVCIIV